MVNKKESLNHLQRHVLFMVLVILFLSYIVVRAGMVNPNVGDAGDYLTISQGYTIRDPFNFRNYPKEMHGTTTVRGYLLPHIIYSAAILPSRIITLGVNQWAGLFCGALFVLSSFLFLKVVFRVQKLSLLAYAGFLGLTLLFWEGLFIYVLSDMYALSFILIAISLLFWTSEQRQEKKFWKNILGSFGAGVALYAAYNIRPGYSLACFLLVAVFGVCSVKAFRFKSIILVLVMIAGAASLAWPQMQVNLQNHGAFSIAVITTG
jgi:hypothetical protein